MRAFPVFLFFCLVSTTLLAQTSKSTKNFIPANWKLLQQADGDLNNDGIADAVLLVENTLANKTGGNTRVIKVLLKSEPVYVLTVEADKAIPDHDPNMIVDVSNALKIEKGLLVITFQTPATNTTFVQYYKYKDKNFVLVRAAQSETQGSKTSAVDFDMVAGQMIIDKKDSSNPTANPQSIQERKMPSLPGIKEFDPAMYMGFFKMLASSNAQPMKPQGTNDSETIVVTEAEMNIGEKTQALVTLDDASMDNCLHIIFSQEDYGSAEINLTLRERLLWKELTIKEGTTVKVNPKYKGKDFEIVYTEKKGIACGSSAEQTIRVIEQFSLANQ